MQRTEALIFRSAPRQFGRGTVPKQAENRLGLGTGACREVRREVLFVMGCILALTARIAAANARAKSITRRAAGQATEVKYERVFCHYSFDCDAGDNRCVGSGSGGSADRDRPDRCLRNPGRERNPGDVGGPVPNGRPQGVKSNADVCHAECRSGPYRRSRRGCDVWSRWGHDVWSRWGHDARRLLRSFELGA